MTTDGHPFPVPVEMPAFVPTTAPAPSLYVNPGKGQTTPRCEITPTTSWRPTLGTDNHVQKSLAFKYEQAGNFTIMSLSQNRNFGTEENKLKEFLKGHLLCGSPKTFFLI